MTRVPAGHPFLDVLRARGMPVLADAEWTIVRFNENHDPDTGQFTSGSGGGSSSSVEPTESIPSASLPNASKPKPAEAHTAPAAAYAFVSPSVASHLDFHEAVDAIKNDQQRELREASLYINGSLGIRAQEYDVVGAWADGAENSTMDVVEGSDWDKLKLAGSMKGWLADQKQVLIFQESPGGQAAMAHFEAAGELADIHKGLLQDGVLFHTLVPHAGGATVYVADLDGTALDSIKKAAARYDAEVSIKFGHAEFLGTKQEDGSDREQRDDARAVYERDIRQSKVAGHNEVWQRVRDRWGQGIHEGPLVGSAQSASSLFDKYNDPTATADKIIDSVPGASVAVEAAERNLAASEETKHQYTQADGTYTSERRALHDQILRELFNPSAVQAAKPAPGEKPVMTLLGGRGGSGKSWFTKHGIADAAHAIYINSDDVQAKLPGYEGWNAALFHDEAADITQQADEIAKQLGVSVIHDATMRTPGGSTKRVADYKAAGYEVQGHYMFLPPQVSTRRAMERFVRGGSEGRYVPASYLLNSTTNERTFDSLKGQFDKWSIYENTGSSPKLVAAGEQAKRRNGRLAKRQVRERSEPARSERRAKALSKGLLGQAGRVDGRAEEAPAEVTGRRAFDPIIAYTQELFARYNPNHDPDTGEFAEGDGGGSSSSDARWIDESGSAIDTEKVEAKNRENVEKASALARSKGVAPLEGSVGEHPSAIATRNPTGKGATGAYGQPDLASMKLDPKRYDHDMGLFKNANFYPNFRAQDLSGSTDKAARAVVDEMKDNLKFLYQYADKHTQVWYDGARALVDDRVKLYGFNDASVAAVYAALSPTKDWDQNVHLADVLMDTYKHQQDHRWDAEMDKTAHAIWSTKNQALVSQVKGKTLGELTDPVGKAIWIRTYDQAHSDASYRSVLPNGALGPLMRNKDGAPSKVIWQSLPAITNAVKALEANGDRKIISDAMGNAHKVRSFYNNILDPNSANGDVTIDTHAVGAALLRQLSGSTAAVLHNFGNAPMKVDKPEGWEAAGSSVKTGLSGLYAVYAQAYREAASELGIQPRQLQSAVWVVKRETLGKASQKQLNAVEEAWHEYHDEPEVTLQQTREKVAQLVGLEK